MTTLVVKVKLGAELHRLPVHNEEQTYEDFLMMLSTRVFPHKLSPSDDIRIKYSDEGVYYCTIDTTIINNGSVMITCLNIGLE